MSGAAQEDEMAAKKVATAKAPKVKAGKTAKKTAAKKAKLVTFKDVRAFVKAAVAKKLPKGVSVTLDHPSVIVELRSQRPFPLDSKLNVRAFLEEVLAALGIKAGIKADQIAIT